LEEEVVQEEAVVVAVLVVVAVVLEAAAVLVMAVAVETPTAMDQLRLAFQSFPTLIMVAMSRQTTEMETAMEMAMAVGHQEETDDRLAVLAVILPILTEAVPTTTPKPTTDQREIMVPLRLKKLTQ
jgi:hypothetical protein